MAKGNDRHGVLVTRFSALGDVAMTIPVLYDACLGNPDCHFVMLTRSLPAKMMLDTPGNLEVVPVNLDRYRGIRGMKKLLDETADKYHIDTYVDLHDVLRTKLLRFFARLRGIKVVKVDKGRADRRRLTRRDGKEMMPITPMSERYAEAFRNAGLEINPSFTSLFPDGPAAANLFASASVPKEKGETWIAVAPFAAHTGKVYPLPMMRQVVAWLAMRPHTRIFIFGSGAQEIKDIDELSAGLPNVASMAKAAAGISAELALMSHCDVMVAMDSANMHLASLVGIPVVSVWGATHPAAGFYGFNQNPGYAVQRELDCRPCSVYGNKPCHKGYMYCMNWISPKMIVRKVESVLDKKTR